MTDTQKDQLQELFTRYGSPWNENIDRTIYLHFYHPDKLDKVSEVARYDKRAAEDIQALEKNIEQLKIYRLALAERYNYLATAPLTPVIELKRQKNYYSKKVIYYIYFYSRDLNTNKDILMDTKVYSGTERKKAIEDFNTYVASHPGIIAIKDIQKGQWEK